MKTTYTTHLICAPQLSPDAVVAGFRVAHGERVEADAVLIELRGADGLIEVSAPEAGLIDSFMVGLDEIVQTGDLLLTMEVEEKPFGFMGIAEEPEYAPACQSLFAPPPPVAKMSSALQISPEAARMAGLLALDLSEVRPGPDGEVDEEAVAAHVRDILIRWRKVRRLLTDAD